ncbi:MAG: hypothetical protein JXB29_05240 [Sedimentisphaerales bacterium]|nr:hypothetical protein [Sedimentisphaerales bacterium]
MSETGNNTQEQDKKKSSLKKKKRIKRVLIILSCIIGVVSIFLLIFGWILSHTSEIAQHNMNAITGNVVYLHKDGHQEAVYDSSVNLVTDDENQASYNYYHPHEQPLRHFLCDTLPWILWENTEKDSTLPSERFSAWWTNVRYGAKKAFSKKEK